MGIIESLTQINPMVNLNNQIILMLFVYMLTASFIDIRDRKIPDKLNLTFFLVRLLGIFFYGLTLGNLYGLLFGFLIILIPAMIANKPMGGDIKMGAVLGFYIGPICMLLCVFFTVLHSLLFIGGKIILEKVFKKEIVDDSFPFAPFFAAGFINLLIYLHLCKIL